MVPGIPPAETKRRWRSTRTGSTKESLPYTRADIADGIQTTPQKCLLTHESAVFFFLSTVFPRFLLPSFLSAAPFPSPPSYSRSDRKSPVNSGAWQTIDDFQSGGSTLQRPENDSESYRCRSPARTLLTLSFPRNCHPNCWNSVSRSWKRNVYENVLADFISEGCGGCSCGIRFVLEDSLEIWTKNWIGSEDLWNYWL